MIGQVKTEYIGFIALIRLARDLGMTITTKPTTQETVNQGEQRPIAHPGRSHCCDVVPAEPSKKGGRDVLHYRQRDLEYFFTNHT